MMFRWASSMSVRMGALYPMYKSCSSVSKTSSKEEIFFPSSLGVNVFSSSGSMACIPYCLLNDICAIEGLTEFCDEASMN